MFVFLLFKNLNDFLLFFIFIYVMFEFLDIFILIFIVCWVNNKYIIVVMSMVIIIVEINGIIVDKIIGICFILLRWKRREFDKYINSDNKIVLKRLYSIFNKILFMVILFKVCINVIFVIVSIIYVIVNNVK